MPTRLRKTPAPGSLRHNLSVQTFDENVTNTGYTTPKLSTEVACVEEVGSAGPFGGNVNEGLVVLRPMA